MVGVFLLVQYLTVVVAIVRRMIWGRAWHLEREVEMVVVVIHQHVVVIVRLVFNIYQIDIMYSHVVRLERQHRPVAI